MFLTDMESSARDYALYGPNQNRRTKQPGFVSVYRVINSNIERANSFQEAYAKYGVKSTQELAKRAIQKGSVSDFLVVYDEWILLKPSAVSFLKAYSVNP